jgi:hypothetical protein
MDLTAPTRLVGEDACRTTMGLQPFRGYERRAATKNREYSTA